MNDLYLIVEIAGQRALLPAAFVESVVEIEDIAPGGAARGRSRR
jgi:purine-binding chemotaxis protein CheW